LSTACRPERPPGSFRDLSCGEHTVAIRAPGYLEQSSTVKLPAFETLTVEVTLKKEEFGTLVVDITPLEASVKVDGIDVGVGPRSIERIATGPHTVEGSSNGYHPMTLDLTVEPDQVARANLSLIPLSQSLEPPTPKKEAGPVARIVLNSAVSLLGLGSTGFGVARFAGASAAFQDYQTVSSSVEAERIYAEEVVPMRTQAYIFGGTGIALLGGSAALWATTKF